MWQANRLSGNTEWSQRGGFHTDFCRKTLVSQSPSLYLMSAEVLRSSKWDDILPVRRLGERLLWLPHHWHLPPLWKARKTPELQAEESLIEKLWHLPKHAGSHQSSQVAALEHSPFILYGSKKRPDWVDVSPQMQPAPWWTKLAEPVEVFRWPEATEQMPIY